MRNETDLVKACLEGDAAARKELYDRYSSKLWMVCIRFARNSMLAEDIFQEGFIRIFENLASYQGQGPFEAWLRRIMVNAAINFYKKNKRHITDSEHQGSKTESWYYGDAIINLSAQEMLKMVQALPEHHKVVFNLFALEGYSHKEIADMIGISENTSKSRMLRSRLFLQDMIEKIGQESQVYEKQRRI